MQSFGRGIMKATNDELLCEYAVHKSVTKTAKRFSMCVQSVSERLIRLGIRKQPEFSESQKKMIHECYNSGFRRGDGKLESLCLSLGKSKQNVSRYARRNGLSNAKRSVDAKFAKQNGVKVANTFKKQGHPRGTLGMKHTEATKRAISISSIRMAANMSKQRKSEIVLKSMKTREKNGTLHGTNREGCSWKAAWRVIGGKRKYFRSRWEANYARYLEFLKVNGKIEDWEHEPKTFWFEKIKRGARSYLPDFRITENDGSQNYVEVKGWMDARSKTKIKRMAKYHRDVKLSVVDAKAYEVLRKQCIGLIAGWE